MVQALELVNDHILNNGAAQALRKLVHCYQAIVSPDDLTDRAIIIVDDTERIIVLCIKKLLCLNEHDIMGR